MVIKHHMHANADISPNNMVGEHERGGMTHSDSYHLNYNSALL